MSSASPNKENLVIVNTRVANLASVAFAFRRLGVEPVISADPEVIRNADRVVLPGVGTAEAAMRALHEIDLVSTLQSLTQPVLGICLGMQMLTRYSTETRAAEPVPALGVIPTHIERLRSQAGLPLPHMGWNRTEVTDHPLFEGLEQPWFYFVHSFVAPVDGATIASCDYGQPFAAAIANGNFLGVQFHPERSGADGARVLQNFLEFTC